VILTEMPDLPPRPLTPRNAQFRREFYRRWGRENCIVSGSARRAEYRQIRQTLSLKCMARGVETYFLDRRRITVSDDTYLVLNEGRVYGSVLQAPSEAYSFSIFFRPGLAQEVAGDLRRSLATMLDDGSQSLAVPMEFDEALRAHDSGVTPVLRFIQRQVVAGVRDEHWLEEQCQFLLARLLAVQHKRQRPFPEEFAAMRPGKRTELLRRMECATDFMHAHLAADISLKDIAAAAHLSRFHFLRLFRLVRGCTPVAALRALRTRRALALLETTSLTTDEIADRVGMSRSALWRNLCDTRLAGARELRRPETPGIPKVSFLGRPVR
jgi:AraC family transcriptional regulator